MGEGTGRESRGKLSLVEDFSLSFFQASPVSSKSFSLSFFQAIPVSLGPRNVCKYYDRSFLRVQSSRRNQSTAATVVQGGEAETSHPMWSTQIEIERKEKRKEKHTKKQTNFVFRLGLASLADIATRPFRGKVFCGIPSNAAIIRAPYSRPLQSINPPLPLGPLIRSLMTHFMTKVEDITGQSRVPRDVNMRLLVCVPTEEGSHLFWSILIIFQCFLTIVQLQGL